MTDMGTKLGTIIRSAFLIVMVFLMLAPIFAALPISFSSGSFMSYPLPGLSLQWYSKVMQPQPWMSALVNSLSVGLISAALATVLGTLAAFALRRGLPAGQSALIGLMLAPMIIPSVIYGVGVYYFFADWNLNSTFTGLVITHTVLGVPFVILPVYATLFSFDFTLVRAAYSLGATPFEAFRKVVFPCIAPGVYTGMIFAFVTSFDELVVTLFVAGPHQRTLPRQMMDGVRDSIDPSIMAASVLLITFSMILMTTILFLTRKAK